MQITRKSVCRQIPNSAPFFVAPWPTSRTLVDVLDVLRLCARCSQAMSNLQIVDIFDFPRAPPTHSIWVPKGLALQIPISPRWWATPTIKSFKKTMPKTRPHQERFEKMCMGDNILSNHNCGGGSADRKPAIFF